MFKILIAEDDNELRQLFKSVLVKNGYNVKSVGDGMDALTEIKNNYYEDKNSFSSTFDSRIFSHKYGIELYRR